MFGEVYRSRVKDWIHGARSAEPSREVRQTLEQDPMSEAERLRIIYQLITNPESEGGAGITPKKGEWENVESVFALHDHVYNKEWIKKWSTQWLLKPEDLDEIRNRMGEKIAYYFAFTQAYFTFLLFPCWLWTSGLGLLGILQQRLRYRLLTVVYRLHRVLEASGVRPGTSVERAWCECY